MNTEIRYLQLLEDDLSEAAEREERTTPMDSRRLPQRDGRRWGAIAAGLVAFLVLAGGIGTLTQGGLGRSAADSAAPAQLASSVGEPTTSQAGVGAGPVKAAPPVPQALPATGSERDLSTGSAPGTPGFLPAIGDAPQADLSKIIRDGRIGILLDDGTFGKAVGSVTFIANRNGGMVLSSSTRNDASGQFTLRIPAKNFDRAMLQLRSIAGRGGNAVLYQDVTGQDVTAQFVDLQARLSILKGQRALLISLRDQATTVNAILSLSRRVDAVQLQIEQIQGNLNVLNDQVAMSTVRVELREKGSPQAETSPDVDKPSLGTAWDRALQGFLRVIGAVIVGLGYLIPLAVIGLAIWGGVTLARRRRRAAN